MRGKVVMSGGYIGQTRITPAYAGKSPAFCGQMTQQQDHPRLCGEKFSRILVAVKLSGSPPPMRGKVREFLFFRLILGITPAYAGKRNNAIFSHLFTRDHPRLCGEKHTFMITLACSTGSPPPMRGKGGFHFFAADRQGITPAYAGKRKCATGAHLACGDHPRLCGEKTFREVLMTHLLRITPAYAGKS